MSTLPAQCRAAWAQIVVEINEVRRFAVPRQGCMQISAPRDLLHSGLRSDSTMQYEQGKSPIQRIHAGDWGRKS